MDLSRGLFTLGAAFLLAVALNSKASAGTTFCSPTGIAGFSLTTLVESPCVGFGPADDINNGVPAVFPAGYTLLDKSDDATTGPVDWENAISFTGITFDGAGKPTGGAFTITPGSGFGNLILAFRDGQNHEDGYGAFLIGSQLSGSWAIINPPQGLSHFSLYGQASPVPGPLVGAGLPGLFVACGALVVLARRRRLVT